MIRRVYNAGRTSITPLLPRTSVTILSILSPSHELWTRILAVTRKGFKRAEFRPRVRECKCSLSANERTIAIMYDFYQPFDVSFDRHTLARLLTLEQVSFDIRELRGGEIETRLPAIRKCFPPRLEVSVASIDNGAEKPSKTSILDISIPRLSQVALSASL